MVKRWQNQHEHGVFRMKVITRLLQSQAGKIAIGVVGFALAVATQIDGVFHYDGEKIIKVVDLPDKEDFVADNGAPLDLAYIYKQVIIVWILPVWNYDGRWCLHDGTSESYYDIDKAEWDAAMQNDGLALPDKSPVPFWDAIGGKLVLIGGALLAIFGIRVINRQDESDNAGDASDNATLAASSESTVTLHDTHICASYHVARGGENIGEFTEMQIRAFLSEGSLSPEDFFFDATRDEWVALTNLPHTS